MADTKISGLSAGSAPSATDLLIAVDVSDTSMAPSGTNKKIDAKWFLFTNGTANTLANNIAANSKNITNLGTVHIAGPLRSTFNNTLLAGAVVQSVLAVDNSYTRLFMGYNAIWDFNTNLWNIDTVGANDAVGWLLRNNSSAIDFIFHPSTGAFSRTMNHATFSAGAKFTMTSTGRLGILNTSPTYQIDTLVGAGAQNIARFGQSGVSNGLTVTSDGSTVSATMTGNLDVTGTLGSTWTGLSFFSGWTDFGGAYTGGGYKKIGDMVFLRGLVARASGVLMTIATLPSGYRPTAKEIFGITSASAYGQVTIDSAGVITLDVGTPGSSVSLSGISFSTL